MNVEQEIADRYRWVREARLSILIARLRLALLWLPELCGIRWAYLAADDQRDIIGHGQYAIQKFVQVADKMRRRGRVETWDA